MSTEKLDAYLELYSKYISLSVDLHNYHLINLRTKGVHSSVQLRSTLLEMRKTVDEMKKLVYLVRREYLDNWKEEVKTRKALRPDGTVRRYNYPKKGKKKNGNNNESTTKTI